MNIDNVTLGDYLFAKIIGKNYPIYLMYIYPKLVKYYMKILKKIGLVNILKILFKLSIDYNPCHIKEVYDLLNCISLLSDIFDIKIEKNFIIFTYKDKILRFIYGEPIRDILFSLIEQFKLEQYSLNSLISPKGLEVIDIGAYIGDSAIWFSINGANHVYAIEPYPYAFQMAKVNVELNNINNITLINAGIGNVRTKIKIPDTVSNRYSELPKSSLNEGIDIPIFTLEDVVHTYDVNEALLKMDCEGCEKVILYTNTDTLRRFKYIIIEYDYGYLDLMHKLKKEGFKVKKWKRPRIANDRITGILFAIRL